MKFNVEYISTVKALKKRSKNEEEFYILEKIDVDINLIDNIRPVIVSHNDKIFIFYDDESKKFYLNNAVDRDYKSDEFIKFKPGKDKLVFKNLLEVETNKVRYGNRIYINKDSSNLISTEKFAEIAGDVGEIRSDNSEDLREQIRKTCSKLFYHKQTGSVVYEISEPCITNEIYMNFGNKKTYRSQTLKEICLGDNKKEELYQYFKTIDFSVFSDNNIKSRFVCWLIEGFKSIAEKPINKFSEEKIIDLFAIKNETKNLDYEYMMCVSINNLNLIYERLKHIDSVSVCMIRQTLTESDEITVERGPKCF